MPYCRHVRAGGVGSLRSTDEAAEQRGATFGGSCGGKAATQRELCTIQHGSDSERGTCVTGVGRSAPILRRHYPREEPCAVVPLARIYAGLCQERARKSTMLYRR